MGTMELRRPICDEPQPFRRMHGCVYEKCRHRIEYVQKTAVSRNGVVLDRSLAAKVGLNFSQIGQLRTARSIPVLGKVAS
jgi:hypothetical protein